MKSILIEIDADTATRLERVAPAHSRRRSEFVRDAIRRALWDLEERATREAYAREPDAAEEGFDASVWESSPPAARRARKRSH